MSRPLLHAAFWAAILPCAVQPTAGHQALQDQIEDLSRSIQNDPGDALLFLRRAELRRIHRDWSAARADYDAARRIDPRLEVVDLCLGRMFLDQDRPRRAKAALDRYLRKRPEDAEGLTLRGRAHARLGRPNEAVDDYRRALTPPAARPPDPDTYLELARLLAVSGGDDHLEAALRTLEQGIAVLGPIVSLELPAIDLEIALRRFDAALRRVDSMAPHAARRERWILRRAAILAEAGRAQEAGRAYQEVLTLIASLPEERQATPAVREIAARARAGLAGLAGSTVGLEERAP